MEKIKQALERAERDRLALGAGTVHEPAGLDAANSVPRVVQSEVSRALDGGESSTLADSNVLDFTYTQTRVQRVSDKTLDRNRIVRPNAASEASRAYDALASRLLQVIDDNDWRSIAVVSALPGDGKSVTAANLALHIAASRERSALLVELDFREPSLADAFGIEPLRGVDDVLVHGAKVSDALLSPDIPRFTLLPVREVQSDATAIMDSSRLQGLASEFKERYTSRVVVFDLPPILANGDATRFLPCADACLFVATEGQTSAEAIERCLASMGDVPVIGSVMNQSTETVDGY